MKYLVWILFIGLITTGCLVRKKHIPSNYDPTLWNNKTLTSIKEQLSSTKDKALKKELKNHLNGARIFLYDKGEGKDGKSLRAKFLETIFSDNVKPRDFFVLEYVQKGERYELKNILVTNFGDTSKVTFYEYFGDRWHIVGETVLNKIDLHREVAGPIQIRENRDLGVTDVVLSEFAGSNITSHLYPNSMIGSHNLFFGVLVQSINLVAIAKSLETSYLPINLFKIK